MVIDMQGDSTQQTGALLHTKLPTIRTKLKQRPGKRKAAAAVSAKAAPTIAELPWMQEWIATGALPGAKDTLSSSAYHPTPVTAHALLGLQPWA